MDLQYLKRRIMKTCCGYKLTSIDDKTCYCRKCGIMYYKKKNKKQQSQTTIDEWE